MKAEDEIYKESYKFFKFLSKAIRKLQAEEIFEDFDCFVGKCGHEKEYAMLKKKWGVK